MHILIANDDGYRAPGIQALAKAMARFGRVTIVAPAHNHSGASNSITLQTPVIVDHMEGENLYIVTGTPSDCVHIALTGLLDDKPDLIVSGINAGHNMGDDTLYSGTVAAAMEGYLFGVPSFAFSQLDWGWKELDSAARVAQNVIESYLNSRQDTQPLLLNVNIPNMPYALLKGIVTTRLGRRGSAKPVTKITSPRGNDVYWLGAAGAPSDDVEGTDFWATTHGYVSVTPLQVDLTAHRQIDTVKRWADQPFTSPQE